ncbi:hypothetical protein CLBKND_02365 [Methylorubrum aminovorans]
MKTRTKRILLGIGFTLLVAFTSTGGLLLAAHSAMRPNPASRPLLAEGLPHELRSADRVFAKRVLTAFPVGLPEADLVRTLDAQGFQCREIEGRRQSSFVQQATPCQHTWSIDWIADNEGRIAEIKANDDPVCL